jgi:hypothetical protein
MDLLSTGGSGGRHVRIPARIPDRVVRSEFLPRRGGVLRGHDKRSTANIVRSRNIPIAKVRRTGAHPSPLTQPQSSFV